METNIDCLKHRTSTHLAGVDVEIYATEHGGFCELTIDLAYYDTNVEVNGRKMDGYFIRFVEPVKEMVVNTGNRKKISQLVMAAQKLNPVESRNLKSWVGMKVRLKYDMSVKMKGVSVGGIVVDTTFNQPVKMSLKEAKTLLSEVKDRKTFEHAMREAKDFLINDEIKTICQTLATKYPKI